MSYKLPKPDATQRRTHWRMCPSRRSACRAVAANIWPSAHTLVALARLARATRVFCYRSHPSSVVHVASLRAMSRAERFPCMPPSPNGLRKYKDLSATTWPVSSSIFRGICTETPITPTHARPPWLWQRRRRPYRRRDPKVLNHVIQRA
jgi:hypothetical protein